MCWCSRIKPCLGVTGALCLVFLPPHSYRFTVGPSYDLLFLCVPWVGYITYFHWPALFFSCAHTHTELSHISSGWFSWRLGRLWVKPSPAWTAYVGLFKGLDFIFFPLVSWAHSVKPANLPASASILKPVSVMHYSVKNEHLERKTKVGAKKKRTNRKR